MIKAAGIGLLVLSSSMFANAAEAAQKIAYVNTAQVFQALPNSHQKIAYIEVGQLPKLPLN